MNALSFVFVLLLLNLGSSAWTLYSSEENVSETLPKFSNYSPIQASGSVLPLLLLFCSEILRGRMKYLGFCVFTFLLQLLVC